jgi:membrane fusion protein (multidrug efflux system)
MFLENKYSYKKINQNNKMSTATKTKRKTGSHRFRVILINAFVFILIASGLIWIVKSYFHIGDENFTNDAQVEAFINPINTRVSAYIKEIRFIEHQQVKKGDTLLVLDDREIQTQVGQAEAAYMNALAARNTTSSSVRTVSNNVSVAESNIAGAKARLWNAEQNFKRYENLLKDEAVTRQQYDQMRTEYEAQKAQYDALVNQRTTTDLSISETSSRLGINDAEIKRTKAALEMSKLNLSYTVITAPYDGIMGRRMINEGQLLQPGQQVATIVTDDAKWITANYREKQMDKVQIGKKMSITVDALQGKNYEGEVTAISAATGSRYAAVPVDNSTGNFVKVQQRIPVRIEFTKANKPEDLALLRAGMNVVIRSK